MSTNNPATARKGAHPAAFLMIVGILFLFFWGIGIITQIQTNEAFIAHSGEVNVYRPNWSIIMQPLSLVGVGEAPNANDAVAIIFGFGIELIYLGFIIGYEVVHDTVQQSSGKLMASLFRSGSWAIVAFNGYIDFNYGTLGSGFWGHFFFALMTSFIVGFFGTIGMHLIQAGWKRA